MCTPSEYISSLLFYVGVLLLEGQNNFAGTQNLILSHGSHCYVEFYYKPVLYYIHYNYKI